MFSELQSNGLNFQQEFLRKPTLCIQRCAVWHKVHFCCKAVCRRILSSCWGNFDCERPLREATLALRGNSLLFALQIFPAFSKCQAGYRTTSKQTFHIRAFLHIRIDRWTVTGHCSRCKAFLHAVISSKHNNIISVLLPVTMQAKILLDQINVKEYILLNVATFYVICLNIYKIIF